MICSDSSDIIAVKKTLLAQVTSVMNNLIFLNNIVCYFFM